MLRWGGLKGGVENSRVLHKLRPTSGAHPLLLAFLSAKIPTGFPLLDANARIVAWNQTVTN